MTTNVSTFLNDSMDRLFKERDARRRQSVEIKKIEADTTLRREALRKQSPQEETKFNPQPGTLSDFPQTDAASRRGPVRFSFKDSFEQVFTNTPFWVKYVVIGVSVMILFSLFKRR